MACLLMVSLQSLTEPPAGFFVEIDKLVLKFIWKLKGPGTAKTFFKRPERIHTFCSKLLTVELQEARQCSTSWYVVPA